MLIKAMRAPTLAEFIFLLLILFVVFGSHMLPALAEKIGKWFSQRQ